MLDLDMLLVVVQPGEAVGTTRNVADKGFLARMRALVTVEVA